MKKTILLLMTAMLIIVNMDTVNAEAKAKKKPIDIIYDFAESINAKDIDKYLELFVAEEKMQMEEYIDEYGTLDFF